MKRSDSLLKVADVIRHGGLAVIPTDTVYGIVCSALLPESVERLYLVRGRNKRKPCIVLIDSVKRLSEFGVVPTAPERKLLAKVWPGKVSVIFPCEEERFRFLHRGVGSIAFRVPDSERIRSFIEKVGPLYAPSANPEGKPLSRTIEAAREYFGTAVDAYLDGGYIEGEPSTVARIEDGHFVVTRPGAVAL